MRAPGPDEILEAQTLEKQRDAIKDRCRVPGMVNPEDMEAWFTIAAKLEKIRAGIRG